RRTASGSRRSGGRPSAVWPIARPLSPFPARKARALPWRSAVQSPSGRPLGDTSATPDSMPPPPSAPTLPPISGFLLLLALTLVGLALLVLKAAPRARANRSLSGGALSVAVWVVGVSGLQTGTHLRMWLALAFSGSAFIPATLLTLVRYYPVTTGAPSFILLATSYLLAIVFSLCGVTTPLLFSNPRVADGAFVRDSGPFYHSFVAYFVVAWL